MTEISVSETISADYVSHVKRTYLNLFSLYIICFYYIFICVYYVSLHVVPTETRRGCWVPEPEITDGCGPSNMDAGNSGRVLCKSRSPSLVLHHVSRPLT